jgi:hypothetical protein
VSCSSAGASFVDRSGVDPFPPACRRCESPQLTTVFNTINRGFVPTVNPEVHSDGGHGVSDSCAGTSFVDRSGTRLDSLPPECRRCEVPQLRVGVSPDHSCMRYTNRHQSRSYHHTVTGPPHSHYKVRSLQSAHRSRRSRLFLSLHTVPHQTSSRATHTTTQSLQDQHPQPSPEVCKSVDPPNTQRSSPTEVMV